MLNKNQIFGNDRYIVGAFFMGLAIVFWGAAVYLILTPEKDFDDIAYKKQEVLKCQNFAKINGYKTKRLKNNSLELVTTDFSDYNMTFIKVRETALACNNMLPVTFCLGEGELCGLPEEPFGIRIVFKFTL